MKKNISIIAIVIVSALIFLLQFQYKKTYQPHTYYQVYLDDKIIGTIESKDDLEAHINKQGALIKNQILEYREQLEILEGVDSIISKKLRNNTDKTLYLNMKKDYDNLTKLVDENGAFHSQDYEKVESLLSNLKIGNAILSNTSISNYKNVLGQIEINFLDAKSAVISRIKESNLSLSETEKYYLEEYASQDIDTISYVKQKYIVDYIAQNEAYEYTDNVYSPIGINIEKINTYYASLSSVDDVYQNIIKEKPCTIEGYQFRIKKSEEQQLPIHASTGALLLEEEDFLFNTETDDVIIYVTDEKVFKDAVEKLEMVFAGTEDYEKYKNSTQNEIVDTGSRIEDIYVEEDITIKKTNISVGEKIYNDADELSSFLLYGDKKSVKTVYASAGDDILSLTYRNGITIEEFFLSNPSFTSINNIFYDKQPVVIAQTNPQLSVVIEKFTVEDMETDYKVEEKYDSKLNMGVEYVDQKGKKGLERVSQNVKSVNGQISFVEPVSNVTLKKAQNEIILIGTKNVPTIGSLASWYWPTNSGYRISSYYGWRKYPFGSRRELHTGIDIAGTGYGSPVYATNNGKIVTMREDKWNYGTHIIINHGNGFYSLYGHMSRFAKGMKVGTVVSRGQVIGYVGDSGAATGPHLHFEIRTCERFSCTTNPLPYLRK